MTSLWSRVRAVLVNRRGARISGAVVVLSAFAFVAAVLTAEGFAATRFDLDDGSVWVTSAQDGGRLGRINGQVWELDSSLAAPSPTFDVVQSGRDVIAYDETKSTLRIVDPVSVKLTPTAVAVPGGSQVALGGDGPAAAVAILDATAGRLWVRTPTTLASLIIPADAVPTGVAVTVPDPSTSGPPPSGGQGGDPPEAGDLGKGAQVVVGTDGTVFEFSPERGEVRRFTIVDGRPVSGPTWSLPNKIEPPKDSKALGLITAVGSRPVVMDPVGHRLFVEGADSVDLSSVGENAVLQLPGPSRPSVIVAADGRLGDVPLDGGAVTTVADAANSTNPVAPAVTTSCVYSAWATSPKLLKSCRGSNPIIKRIDAALSSNPHAVRFRVNRNAVVLNDIDSGNSFALDQEIKTINNWGDVKPPDEKDTEDSNPDSKPGGDPGPHAESEQQPPVANPDDQFGARPGRATVLTVLDNDTDANGDLLTVAKVSMPSLPDARVDIIGDGRAVQLSLPAGASGTVAFTYQASDGRAVSNDATVTVKIIAGDENTPPKLKEGRTPSFKVVEGKSATYQVLDDWFDAEGDPLSLLQVTPAATGGGGDATQPDGATDQILTTPEGQLTFTAGQPGERKVQANVSDGADTGTGTINVSVSAAEAVPAPTAVDDLASASVGETITISPLDNDVDPGGSRLALTGVTPSVGADSVKLDVDLDRGTIRFTSSREGSYVLSYGSTTSPVKGTSQSATGRIRVEVKQPVTGLGPVAVTDVVSVPTGGSALVDAVANDVSPGRLVLVITDIQVPPGLGLTATLLENRVVRVALAKPLAEGRSTITYTVSDGINTPAQGTIVVVEVAPSASPPPPIARPDTITVRVGGQADIPVLANDSSPSGDKLTLRPNVSPVASGDTVASEGYWFADPSAGLVRYVAPDKPATLTLVYTVEDSQSNRSSSTVTVHVVKLVDPPPPPRPLPLEARVIAGQQVRIVVPLDGIDPGGDSVELVGLGHVRPTQGSVANIDLKTPDQLVYLADVGSAGTDTFSYRVRSSRGATAEATVRVGIVAPPSGASQPSAPDLRMEMAPGSTDTIDPLKTASDPQGRPLRFDPDRPVSTVAGFEITVVDGPSHPLLQVKAPPLDGAPQLVRTVAYRVINDVGGTATGVLTVTVSAAFRKPLVARDAPATPATAPSGAATMSFKIVPEFAFDPGFLPGEPALTLTVAPGFANASVDPDGNAITVKLIDQPQVIPYQVSNQPGRNHPGQTAAALIRVPMSSAAAAAANTSVPTLKKEARIDANAGETLIIAVTDFVDDPSGKPITLTQADRVSATNSDGSPLVKNFTTLQYTSVKEFSGKASITFEVTNGNGPDDNAGQRRTFTIEIDVKGTLNRPPSFRSTTVSVELGAEPKTIDLESFVDDDLQDAGKHTFASASVVGADLTATLDGSKLKLNATGGKGQSRSVNFSVADGSNPAVTASLTVSITASTRPPLRPAVDLSIDDAESGKQTRTVNVIDAAFNPFDDGPLTLVGRPVVNGPGSDGSVSADDKGNISYTSSASFFGNVIVTYVLGDKTGDADRQVPGALKVRVRGKPAAPAAPISVNETSETVTLQWQAPQSNGAPITGYRVITDTGKSADAGDVTIFPFSGLVNGTKYRFQVVAHNDMGDSLPSPASAPFTPDQIPSTPTVPPTLTFGDGKIDATWEAVNGNFSTVNGYRLQVAPAPSVTLPDLITGTATSITGLANGTAYRVRYQAVNAKGNSQWSEWSTPEVPAAKPGAPGGVAAQAVCDDALAGQATVTWTAPADGGDALRTFTVFVLAGGVQQRAVSVAGGTVSQNISGVTIGSSYQFEVTATNKAGEGPHSTRSNAVIPCAKPSTIGSLSAAPNDGAATLTFSDPAGNGRPLDHYDVRINGGQIQPLALGQRTVPGLANGTSYTFEVRACHEVCGVFSPASGPVVPYGPPGAPSVSYQGASSQTQARFAYNAPAPNGRTVQALQWSRDATNWNPAALSGTIDQGEACNQSVTVYFRAQDSGGVFGPAASASGATGGCPPPPVASITITRGNIGTSSFGTCTSTSVGCRWVLVTVSNLVPNTGYRVSCQDQGGPEWYGYAFTSDGAGNFSSGNRGCLMGSGVTFQVQIQGPNGATTGLIRY